MAASSDRRPPFLDVSGAHLRILEDILRQHVPGREVWAFGSRVRGHAKPWSDLDLVVRGETVPGFQARGLLQEALEESDLPWKVDLVWWATLPAGFRRILEEDHLVLQEGIADAA